MRKIEIEGCAHRIIDQVEKGQPSEDDRVELKAEWMPDDYDFARQLAGHANAAQGEGILWLFGVDEKAAAAPGVPAKDAASWWPSVVSHFDGPAPEPVLVNVRHNNITVVALYASTDLAPFVVRNPQYGRTKGVSISLEGPWRSNTSTRTAKREDLLRLLLPAASTPRLVVLDLSASAPAGGEGDNKRVDVVGNIYVEHISGTRVHFADHQACGHWKSTAGGTMAIERVKLEPTMRHEKDHDRHASANPNFMRSDEDLTVLGPGRLHLTALAVATRPSMDDSVEARHNFDSRQGADCGVVLERGKLNGTNSPPIIN